MRQDRRAYCGRVCGVDVAVICGEWCDLLVGASGGRTNGVGTVKSAVRCNKREKYTVYAVNCGYDASRYGRFAPDDHHVDGGKLCLRDNNLFGKTPAMSAEIEHHVPSEVARVESRSEYTLVCRTAGGGLHRREPEHNQQREVGRQGPDVDARAQMARRRQKKKKVIVFARRGESDVDGERDE